MIHKDARDNEYQVCTQCDCLKPIESFWMDRRPTPKERRGCCIACESARKKAAARNAYEPTRLPAAPLLRIVEEARIQRETTWEGLAIQLGTSAKTFYEWRRGKRQVVNLETADNIVTGLGFIWEDVFDDKTCERLRAVA